MTERSTAGSGVPDDRNESAEAALGGADAVQKTTYVTGSGTEPEARPRKSDGGDEPKGGEA